MKYFLRTKHHYDESGYLEWSPGRGKWYTISQVDVEPNDFRAKLISFLGDFIFEKKRVLCIEGYYDQIEKKLHVTRVLSVAEVDDQRIRALLKEDGLQEELMLFSEEVFWFEEI